MTFNSTAEQQAQAEARYRKKIHDAWVEYSGEEPSTAELDKAVAEYAAGKRPAADTGTGEPSATRGTAGPHITINAVVKKYAKQSTGFNAAAQTTPEASYDAQLVAAQVQNAAWIVSAQAGALNADLQDVDWSGMYDNILNYYSITSTPVPDSLTIDPGRTAEQQKQDKVKAAASWLGAHQQKAEAYAVIGTYTVQHQDQANMYAQTADGVPIPTIVSLQQNPDIGGYAGLLTHLAARHGVDPMAATDVYLNAVRRGDIQKLPDMVPGQEELTGGKFGGTSPDVLAGRQASQKKSIDSLLQKYQQFYNQFNSHTLASIAVDDLSLAYKLQNSPTSLTKTDMEKINDILGSDTSARQNIPGYTGQEDSYIKTLTDMTYTPTEIDQGSLLNAARTLAAAWNLPDLTDGELANMVDQFASQKRSDVIRAQANPWAKSPAVAPQTSESAYPLEYFRKAPEYKRLFGNKPSGMSESDYAAQMRNQSFQDLGKYDPAAIRAGMAAGDAGAVSQQALLSGSYKQNATMQERMAQLAEIFRSET